MIEFKTDFKNVSAVEIHEPDYVVLFDNCHNVVAIFPRGKYPYAFWSDFIFYFVRDIDFHLAQEDTCAKRCFRALYHKFFCGRRNEEVKKAFQVTAELDVSRPSGEPRRRKSSGAKRKDESAA